MLSPEWLAAFAAVLRAKRAESGLSPSQAGRLIHATGSYWKAVEESRTQASLSFYLRVATLFDCHDELTDVLPPVDLEIACRKRRKVEPQKTENREQTENTTG